MTLPGDKRRTLEKEGFRVIPWDISRGSTNIFYEIRSLIQVIIAYRRVRADLVHHIGLKPVLYGGLASRFCARTPSINVMAGLGHVFASTSLKMRLLRRLVVLMLRGALGCNAARAVFENPDIRDRLVKGRVVPLRRTVVIRGVGVNLREFSPKIEPEGLPIVLLPSRMLWEKGIGDFVESAEALRVQRIPGRFVLVGGPDPANPTSIPEAQLLAWSRSGTVEWWGHRNDMASVFAQSQIVCLPSYAEGAPTVLIEGAACGRPLVATDVPGCREVVRRGENGLLVPPRNPRALAEAIATLLKDPVLRSRMGARGREIAVQEFSEERVVRETLALYCELLGAKWPSATSVVGSSHSRGGGVPI